MPIELELERYYRPEEVDPAALDGMSSEVVSRHRDILEFVDIEEHDAPGANWSVYVQQPDRRSPIVGFGERTPRNRRQATDKRWIEPFHIKDGWPFAVDDPDLELDESTREIRISGRGLARAIDRLEDARLSLYVDALLTMLNEGQFSYIDDADGKAIVIPYDDDIGTITAPDVPLNDSSADVYKALYLARSEYVEDQGIAPNLAFISSRTAATLVSSEEVKLMFRAQQSSDPDKTASTFQRFNIGDMTFVVLDKQYITTGGLKGPIDYGSAIVMVDRLPEDGKSPLRFHKFATTLNRKRPDRPFYDVIQDSADPPQGTLALYDNLLPGIQKRGSVKRWQLWPGD